MYARCLFCNGDLGRNDALESFPVGRRLAYDAEKGRLWVVCRRCERWNLTPLDERWEAIEDAERRFRDTRLRASTDNVGLARLREGLELVRVGRPLRPEFAAWRYGDQFGRRLRRTIAVGAGMTAATGAFIAAGPMLGVVSTSASVMGVSFWNLYQQLQRRRETRRVLAVPVEPGRTLHVAAQHAAPRLLPIGDDRWHFEVRGVLPEGADGKWDGADASELRSVMLDGEAALRAAGALLPRVNAAGGRAATVRAAVALLDETSDPSALFARVARDARERFGASEWQWGDEHAVHRLPAAVRLALEMATHEERERRALDGDLAELEHAWQEAERIAAIADDLLLPVAVDERLKKLR